MTSDHDLSILQLNGITSKIKSEMKAIKVTKVHSNINWADILQSQSTDIRYTLFLDDGIVTDFNP